MTITHDELRRLLNYDPSSGLFTWRVANSRSVKVGSIAGSLKSHGYMSIKLNRVAYQSHRLAWLYVHGVLPNNHIDHINGVKTDNRISNLRDVSNRENQQNRSRHRSGKLVGASFEPSTGRWQSQAWTDGKLVKIGRFATEVEAHEAYIKHCSS